MSPKRVYKRQSTCINVLKLQNRLQKKAQNRSDTIVKYCEMKRIFIEFVNDQQHQLSFIAIITLLSIKISVSLKIDKL